MIPRRSCLTCAALLATLCLARSGAAAAPRWVPLGPPGAPLAARLVVNGNRAYAFNQMGLWLSRDGAGSWRSIQSGLGQAPQAITFDPFRPGRIYAATLETDTTGGIYRSDDFGAHWASVFRGSETVSYAQDLQADPFVKDTLYWATDYQTYRSRDAGRTWGCFPADCAPSFGARLFAFRPDRQGTVYAISRLDVFYASHDGGQTWTDGVPLADETNVLAITRDPHTLYAWPRASYWRGDIYPCFTRSDDEGATWKAVLRGPKCGAPAVDPDDPHKVRMVVVDGRVPQIWVSGNGGDSWSSAGAVPEFGDLYALPGGGLVLATDKGFFRAPAESGPWQGVNRGFGASQIRAVLPVGEAVLAAPVASIEITKPPSLPLLRTEDGGRSWTGEPLINPHALAADPADPHHLIASAVRYEGWTNQFARVLESRDGGHTWQGTVDSQATDRPLLTTLAVDPFEPRTLYGGSFVGFYRSGDGGFTWSRPSAGLPHLRCTQHGCSPRLVSTLLTDPAREGRIFIRLNNSIYASLDGGITWKLLRPHGTAAAGAAYALGRDRDGALIVIGNSPENPGPLRIVYRSTDAGATWTRLGRLLLDSRTGGWSVEFTGLAAAGGALWASTNLEGVFRSTDGGRTWKPANEGLPLLSVTSLAVDPEDPARLYATIPGNGIYTLAAP